MKYNQKGTKTLVQQSNEIFNSNIFLAWCICRNCWPACEFFEHIAWNLLISKVVYPLGKRVRLIYTHIHTLLLPQSLAVGSSGVLLDCSVSVTKAGFLVLQQNLGWYQSMACLQSHRTQAATHVLQFVWYKNKICIKRESYSEKIWIRYEFGYLILRLYTFATDACLSHAGVSFTVDFNINCIQTCLQLFCCIKSCFQP